MKILIIIVFFLVNYFSFTNYSVNKNEELVEFNKDSIYAKYTYESFDGGISLILNTDKTYRYELANHLQDFSSTGKWQIKNDTLVLNSFIQKNNLPILVKMDSINNSSEYLQVDWVKNPKGDMVDNAQIFINGDTNKYCMPAFENDCKIKRNELKSLQLRLGNNLSSKWYNVSLCNSNRLILSLDTDVSFEKYIFFDQEKFIISGKKLYETEMKPVFKNGKTKNKIIKNNRYFLKKVR